jgi:hypothetical protein
VIRPFQRYLEEVPHCVVVFDEKDFRHSATRPRISEGDRQIVVWVAAAAPWQNKAGKAP